MVVSDVVVSASRITCFDVFAGLWVLLYERTVPHAQQEAQQNYLLDELQASTARLKIRRGDIHARYPIKFNLFNTVLNRGM